MENGQSGEFVRWWRSFLVLVNDGETTVTDGVFEKQLGRNRGDTVEYFKGILIETKETGGVYLSGCRDSQEYSKVIGSHSGGGSSWCGPDRSAGMDYCCLALLKDGCLGLHARNESLLSWRSETLWDFKRRHIAS